MSANMMRIRVAEQKDLISNRRFIALVIDLNDGSYKYAKFFLPCDTTGIITGLRALADEIQREYHKG